MRLIRFAAFAVAVSSVLASQASAGLIFHYDFDNDTSGVGGITDQSGQGRHGTLRLNDDNNSGERVEPVGNRSVAVGTFSPSSDIPSVYASGSSQSLSATDLRNFGDSYVDGEFVSVDGYKGVTGNKAFTVTAWIKTSDAYDQVIASWGVVNGGDGQLIGFRLDEASPGNYVARVDVSGGYVSGTTKVNTGEWVHVALVKEAGNFGTYKIYVNGTEDASGQAAVATTVVADSDVLIGGLHTLDYRYFNGLIDDVQMYDEALTDDQVVQTMTSAIPEPSTVALLAMGSVAWLRRRRS